MRQNNRSIGTDYEQLAGQYLEQKGYTVLAYNFRSRNGEIDIIAKDGDTFVFCEVKYRKTMLQGHPMEAVNHRKQQRISKCALYYLQKNGLADVDCRFDVIGILDGEISHVMNAFEYAY